MVSAHLLPPFCMGLRALGGPRGWGRVPVRYQSRRSSESRLAQVASRNLNASARSWGREEEEGIFLAKLEL